MGLLNEAPLSELDNAALVDRVRVGDQAAWRELTDRYTGMLWGLARAMRLSSDDAADAVQTTWLKLVERIDTVREPERLGGWLGTTMRHECLALLRRRSRLVAADDWELRPDGGDPLDARLLRDERDAALWRAFDNLDERCRVLLRVLTADPPPSYADVAVTLDMPVGSIGPRRQRCLSALRRQVLATGDRP